MSGVTVTATEAGESGAKADEATTRSTGTFSLNVPFGTYDLAASTGKDDDGVTFDIPAAYQKVSVAPGQSVNIGTIEAMSPTARGVKAERERVDDVDGTADVDESERAWATTILVNYTANAEDVPVGYSNATYLIQTNTGTDDAWTTPGATGDPVEEGGAAIPGRFTITSPSDAEFMVRVVATVENDDNVDPQHTGDAQTLTLESGTATVSAIDPSASGASAVRGATDADPPVDTLGVSWSAVTDDDSQFRVLIEVSASNLGGATVWFVASGTTAIEDDERTWRLAIPVADSPVNWTSIDGTEVGITRADLLKALKVRVDARQDDVDEDDANDPIWPEDRQGTAVSVDAKPDDSNGS